MQPEPPKGQTSLDFLMTYGWALLLIVVVVGALFTLGVFNVGSFIGPRATGFSQLGVIGWNVNAAGILSLRLQNFAGMDINVINIEATYGTSNYSFLITNVSIPNSKISDTFTVGAISGLAPGQYYTLPLRITYIDLNGFNYTETGTISGTVGAGAVPPSIRINSPNSNSLLNNRTINISVSVWGGNLSQTDIMIINESGTPVNVTTNSQLGTYSVLLDVQTDGVYNITALANYTDGGSASATASNITVNVSAPAGLQCSTLDLPGHVYTMSDDVSSGDTCFTIAADNVTLDCNGHSITGSGSDGYGIYNNHNNVTVENCNITRFYNGIDFEGGANYSTIENNTVNSNSNIGIYLASSSDNIIFNNTVTSNTYGIRLDYISNSNIVSNNNASSNGWAAGIWITYSSNNTVANNIASSNSFSGIYLYASPSNLIYNNLFNNSPDVTVDSQNFWNTTLDCGTTNIVGGPCIGGNYYAQPDGNGWSENSSECNANSSGICTSPYIIDGSNVDELPLANPPQPTELSGCGPISSPGYYYLTSGVSNDSTCFNITANHVTLDCNGSAIIGNGTGNGVGIYLSGNEIVIENCNVSAFQYGIYLDSSSGDTVLNVTVHDNVGGEGSIGGGGAPGYGIALFSSGGNTLSGITAYSNTGGVGVNRNPGWGGGVGAGIYLNHSSNNTVSDVTATGNNGGYGSWSSGGQGNGIYLYYNSESNTITNVTAYSNRGGDTQYGNGGNGQGISLEYNANGNTVANSTLYSNDGAATGSWGGYGTGVWFSGSSGNTISNVTAYSHHTYGRLGSGFYLGGSTNNRLIGNDVSSNQNAGIALYDSSDGNTVANNTADSEGYGFLIMSSNYSTFANNTASNNSYGFYLGTAHYWAPSSARNLIYNNFLNDTYPAWTDGSQLNYWNTTLYCAPDNANIIGGNCTGGNFYANSSGDAYSQNCTYTLRDSWGICDSPYSIDGNDIDHHPLTDQTTSFVQITDCGDITAPGDYILTQDTTDTCSIAVDNVTLDCNGHNMTVSGDGIHLSGTNDTVKDCRVVASGDGIDVSGTGDTVDGCTLDASGSGGYGIRLNGASGALVKNSVVRSFAYGIDIYASSSNTVLNNTVNGSSNGGIRVAGAGLYSRSSNNVVFGNNINNSGTGFYSFFSDSNIISNNTLANSGSTYGSIRIDYCSSDTISNNSVSGSPTCIMLFYSGTADNQIYNNLFNCTTPAATTSTGTNYWNTSLTSGRNIMGGDWIGGNFYATPAGDGFSENLSACVENESGICTSPYGIPGSSDSDNLPLGPAVVRCGTLDRPNKVYYMAFDLENGSTCFTVTASNVTIDCLGHTITYAQSTTGYGVTTTMYLTTIRNCNLVQGNASAGGSYGIYMPDFSSANWLTVTNSNISTSSDSSYGLYMGAGPGYMYNLINLTVSTAGASSHGFYYNRAGTYDTFNNNNLNNITVSTTGASSYGFYLQGGDGPYNNNFSNIAISTTGQSSYGFMVRGGIYPSRNDRFINITISGTGDSSYGFSLSANSDILSNITINETGTNATYLYVEGGSSSTMTGTAFATADGSALYAQTIPLTAGEMVNSTGLNISFNRIFLNASSLSFLNASAELTLLGLNSTTHVPTYDLTDSGVFSDCPGSGPGDYCTVLSDSGGTFVYNVTGFTTYSSRES